MILFHEVGDLESQTTRNKVMRAVIYFHWRDLKKSARFAGTFSSRASRAARFARKFERA